MILTVAEVDFILKEFITDERHRLDTVLKPYISELVNVAMRLPVDPVRLPDGRIMKYVGPIADDIVGPYKAPLWLRELCEQDLRFVELLRRAKRYLNC